MAHGHESQRMPVGQSEVHHDVPAAFRVELHAKVYVVEVLLGGTFLDKRMVVVCA